MNTTRYLHTIGAFLLLALLSSACARESSPPAPPPGQVESTRTFVPLPTQPVFVIEATEEGTMTGPTPQPTPQNSGEAGLVRLAMQDLAGRLNTSQENIELVQLEAVIWPDGSLGCPQPGIEYPQVQSEGYRIQLRYAERLYDYHGGGKRGPFLCETKGS